MIFLIIFPAQSHAVKLWPEDFKDFAYVQWVWNNLETREKLMSEVQKHEASYNEYKDILENDFAAAQKLLKEKTERGDSIRKRIDLVKIFKSWDQGVRAYYTPVIRGKVVKWEDKWACLEKLYFNSFTKGKCTDFPDWRTTKTVQKHEASIKAHLKKQTVSQ